jgi:hypothetical protein
MRNKEELLILDNAKTDQQISVSKSYQEDVVDGFYRIHLNETIHELNNAFCKYYRATSIEDDNEYFAIVFERDFTPPLDIWHKLKFCKIEGLNNLITYSIVKLSLLKAYRLVAIVNKYNFSTTLANFVTKNGPLSLDELEHKLIATIAEVLQQCERINISCGNINPSNIIIMGDSGHFMLREFISSYPSFYQDNSYLAPEIAECIESARCVSGTASDIYSLGVTVFVALTGNQPWADYENIYEFNRDRFEQTSYKLLVGKRKISERLKIFFKKVLHDNSDIRWKIKDIFGWLSGNITKNNTFETLVENTNLLAFNGENYGNLKSISYAFFCHWDEAFLFIHDDKLVKWATRHGLNDDVVGEIRKITGDKKVDKNLIRLGNAEYSNKLTKLLLIIDPQGSIRQKGLAVSAMAIPNAIYHNLTRNKKSITELMVKAMKEKYWQINANSNSASCVDFDTDAKFYNIASIFSANSVIFGAERVMYSLNPYAACLSPLLSGEYVTNVLELLIALDKIAESKHVEFFSIDRHIIAFIAAKLSLEKESEIKVLRDFPKLSDHPLIFGLCVLNLAQKSEPDIKLPSLCSILTTRIIELLGDSLHNVKFKQQIASSLTDVSISGNFSQIVHILSNQAPFIDDYNGYYNVSKEIRNIRNYINLLSSGDDLGNALFLGQKLTVLISYILCFIVTLILTM